MRHLWIAALSAIIAMFTCGPAMSQQTIEPTRQLTIAVTVHSPDGDAVAGVPILVKEQRPEGVAFRTDDDGRASKILSIDARVQELTLYIAPGGEETVPDRVRNLEEHADLLRRWSFKPKYVVPVKGGRCEVDITARPAVQVSGRLVDARGRPPAGCFVVPRDVASPLLGRAFSKERPGEFTIGVPKGTASEVWLVADSQGVRRVIGPAEDSVQLGDVVIAGVPGETTIQVDLEPPADRKGPARSGGVMLVTLVSRNGERFFTGSATWPSPDLPAGFSTPFKIPAGEYYLISSSPVTEEWILSAVEAIRTTQNLGECGVPRIQIAEGENARTRIDPDEVRTAAMKLANTASK
jgi:hypothetical protein